MRKINNSVNLEYTTLEFYDGFVVSQVREGAVLRQEQIKTLMRVCLDNFKEEPFFYISKRVNNYNVDPTIYYCLLEAKNLQGIAVVSDKIASLNMANFEKNFAKVPFEIFTDFPKAIEWVEEIQNFN